MLSTKSSALLVLLCGLCTATLQAQGEVPPVEKAVAPAPAETTEDPPGESNETDSEPAAETTTPAQKPAAEAAEKTPGTTEPTAPPAAATEAVPQVPAEPPPQAEPKPQPTVVAAPAESDFRLMTGVHGGLVIPFNSIHSVGYNFGMTLDYTFLRRYGVHFGAETGVLPARAQTLSASPSNISVLDGGTFGFLNLRLTGMYVFPKVWDLNPSAGFGLTYYQLSGGSYSFQASIAPVAVGSLYYDILPNLQLGVIGQFILATTGKITTTGAEYTLKSATWLTTASLSVSVRYAWF